MAFIERRNRARPSSGEAPFGLRETLFSRTDERGVIVTANQVFIRVSNYEWSETKGSPHKIVRHPDMPKAVFWLLWDSLKRGKPIASYVKNKSKDGLYYWVLAIVVPVSGGFLSVRIKPTSDLFEDVKNEYNALLTAEQDSSVSPEDSARALLERLKELGFEDYETFGSHAVAQELSARNIGLGNQPDRGIIQFNAMAKAIDGLQDETAILSHEFGALGLISANMRIIASHLEPSGGPISALSENYWSIAQEISDWFKSFVSNSGSAFGQIQTLVKSGMFSYGTAQFLDEVSTNFAREKRGIDLFDNTAESHMINGLTDRFIDDAKEGLRDIIVEVKRIATTVPTMRRYIAGLTATRTMCKIENARLPAGGEGLMGIIDQLGSFQVKIEEHLDLIDGHISRIKSCAEICENEVSISIDSKDANWL